MIQKGFVKMSCTDPSDEAPLRASGYPDLSNISAYGESYVSLIDKLRVPQIDLALVNGRFRVASALKLLHYADVVMFEDFFDRPAYHDVLPYYDILGGSGGLAVLRKKPAGKLPTD